MVKRASSGPKAQERREGIVQAGYRAMLRTGLAAVRTRDVAGEAGITVATLHYYFPTKEELVRAVAEYAIEQQVVLPLLGVVEPARGIGWLRAMFEGLRVQAAEESARFRLLNEIIWASRSDPELRELLEKWHGGWHQSIVEALTAGRDQGEIRPDSDLEAIAMMIIYIVFGMVLRPPMPSAYDAEMVDEIDRLLASIHPD